MKNQSNLDGITSLLSALGLDDGVDKKSRARNALKNAVHRDSQGGLQFEAGLGGKVKSICFACTGCGVCCDTPPSMRVDEIYDQAQNFILGAQLRSSANFDLDNLVDMATLEKVFPELQVRGASDVTERLVAHTNARNASDGVPIAETCTMGSSAAILFALVDVDQMSGACPQRTADGRCAIYEGRPAKCRIVPFDESIPEPDAGEALAVTLGHLRARGGTCRVDTGAPVVWSDGAFIEEEARSQHREFAFGSDPVSGEMSQSIIDEYIGFKAHEVGVSRTEIEAAIEVIGARGTRPVFSIVPALARLMREGFLGSEMAVEILHDQIALIDARLPMISPEKPMEGVDNAPMRQVLTDWRGLYVSIANSWSS